MEILKFPSRITIELTNRCNVSCTFCHRNSFDMQLGDISEKLFYKLIDEMSEHLPVKLVPFFRGESILHPQFVEFMQYAKRRGIGPIQLFSNGLAFNDEMGEMVCEAGVDFVSFSLDTLDEDIYAQSRVSGNLGISNKNVIRFAEYCKKRRNVGKFSPELQVSSVDIDVYRSGQEEFIEFWKKYMDIVRIYEEHDENGGFVNAESRNRLSGIKDRRPCHKLYSDMNIYWDGRIALCNYDWNEKHQIGDLNVQSIYEVWNSGMMQEIRKMHEENCISEDYMCARCEHWKAGYLETGYLGRKYTGA